MDYKQFIENNCNHPVAKNLPQLIDYVANNHSNGLNFIQMDGTKKFLPYKDLYLNAKKFAGALIEQNIKGALMICVEESAAYYTCLWACILSGVIAVPLEPLRVAEINNKDYHRLAGIAMQFDNCALVTDAENLHLYEGVKNSVDKSDFTCISVDSLKNGNVCDLPEREPDECVIVQFSSGSTGDPKGIKLTSKNVLAALGGFVCSAQLKESDKVVIWTPQFHNMGMFVHILMMLVAAQTYVFPTGFFIQKPAQFLNLISQEQIDFMVSNNFGLEWLINHTNEEELCADALKYIRGLYVASEVISSNTISRFFEKFNKYGLEYRNLRPAYGLTESTFGIVTVPEGKLLEIVKDFPSEGSAIVCAGEPVPTLSVTIVDSDDNEVGEDEQGEIIMYSDAVTPGYMSNVISSESLYLNGGLRTGDMGFMHNGYLYVSGRKKDIFIVRGHNYMIHDIEHEIVECGIFMPDQIALSSTYSNQYNEEVLVLFISTPKTEDAINGLNTISNKLLSKYGFTFANAVFVPQICRTGTGKVNRNEMVRLFKNNTFTDYISFDITVKSSNNTDKTSQSEEELLLEIWSSVLKLNKNDIDTNVPFSEYGGNSVKQYQMLEKINNKFGINLKPAFLREYQTIKEIEAGIKLFLDTDDVSEQEDESKSEFNKKEEIAITGISFRLPGADNPQELWDLLVKRTNCVDKLSDTRKNLINAPEVDSWLGEIADVDKFDADFFEIPKEEVAFVDPQQRIILETSYEALEDAGEAFVHETPQNTGVFVALSNSAYQPIIQDYIRKKGSSELPEMTLVSNLMNIAAARVSHFFNFSGIAVSMDSACSSFLSALHTARRYIQSGEISSALVSAAHILLTSEELDLAQRAGILSSSDKSKVFDKDADGSVLGEGVVSIFMEPLSSAVNNKKHIYGVIQGSAVNNDGYALSIMAPSSDGQYNVLKRAYNDAGISPSEVTYIEAHGTGTKIGDPIEFRALSKMFSETKTKINKNSIGIGSIKSNIGHLLPAASGAGIIKTLLCLENKTIAPSINMETINPALGIGKTPFYVVTEPTSWNVPEGKKRIAGVTSLGLGGTNAHIIISEWDNKPSNTTEKCYPFVVSAKSEEALNKKLELLKNEIVEHPDRIADICFTLCKYRMPYQYRASCVLHIDDIEKSFENIQRDVYNKIRSKQVYLYLGSDDSFVLNDDECKLYEEKLNSLKNKFTDICEADLKSYFKQKLLVSTLSALLGNITIVVDGKKIACEYWLSDEALTMKYDSNVVSANVEPPKNAVVISINNEALNADYNFSDSEYNYENRELILKVATELFNKGASVNWNVIREFTECNVVHLPAYPFDKKSYWVDL